ncbi:unnamed protein product [Porites lobata]|uniref:Uncharacterized protein n=1 Tax=Porites lobata TaxID=104759 RepID=A0ABN8MR52_9CNID|nr:unnamed protein product [Porites lobata]
MNALSYSSSGVKNDTIGNSFSQQAHLNATSSDLYVVISNDQTVQGKVIDGDAHVHHTLTDAVDIPDNTFWMQDGADDTVDQTKGKFI